MGTVWGYDAWVIRRYKAGTISVGSIGRLLAGSSEAADNARMSLSILGLAYRHYADPVPFGLLQPDRLLHLHLLGQTGTGKSTLLHNLIWQDAKAGRGCCLIDPHGDLAEDVHRSIGTDHLYWDIADPACPLGYNPLAPVSAKPSTARRIWLD